jgi:hypothetical protein
MQGNKVKVNYAENLVSVQKSTVRITESSEEGRISESGSRNSDYAVSFNYDSLVPAVVRIFVGASDRTVPHQIRFGDLTSLVLLCLQLCCAVLCCLMTPLHSA